MHRFTYEKFLCSVGGDVGVWRCSIVFVKLGGVRKVQVQKVQVVFVKPCGVQEVQVVEVQAATLWEWCNCHLYLPNSSSLLLVWKIVLTTNRRCNTALAILHMLIINSFPHQAQNPMVSSYTC